MPGLRYGGPPIEQLCLACRCNASGGLAANHSHSHVTRDTWCALPYKLLYVQGPCTPLLPMKNV